MNVWEVMPFTLLLLFSLAVSVGIGVVIVVARRAARAAASKAGDGGEPADSQGNDPPFVFRSPVCWLAVKSRRSASVQAALGLHNPKPCSWLQGLSGEAKLFIAPPVNGWVLVMGSGLPEPGEDIDQVFRFVLELSRKLGQVQFFSANRVLQYHAWVKARRGRIVRAYAWASKTLWTQGTTTPAEIELGLRCFEYFEAPDPTPVPPSEIAMRNVEKVPLLAARWSIDPGRLDARLLQLERGVAGEPSWRY